MAQINPNVLLKFRMEKRWSLDDLAKESRVDRKTIHQIEKGKRERSHSTTLKKLANALGVKEEVLTAPESTKQSPADSLDEFLGRRSQLNVRIAGTARNALSLVILRYGVRAQEVMELAPFLFFLAAEGSLERRRKKLGDLEARQAEVQGLSDDFPHLAEQIWLQHSQSYEIGRAERESIAKRDLFAERITIDCQSEDYQGSDDNPMTRFLQEQAGSLARFEGWRRILPPQYEICKDDALELVGGDELAAQAILTGEVLLSDLPKDLREPSRVADRTDWIRARAIAATEARSKDEVTL